MQNEKRVLTTLVLALAVVVLGAFFVSGYLLDYFAGPGSSSSIEADDLEHLQVSVAAVQAELSRLSKLSEELLERQAELLSLTSSLAQKEPQAPEEQVEQLGQVEQAAEAAPRTIELRMMRGDTIWAFLHRLGMQPDAQLVENVLRLNGFSDARRIPAGTYIRIPLQDTTSSREETN
ncbi:MAG: hypothetical protein GX855_05975 [Firmicutes bacterium]|nr:hypothetical protein [Bacillota bacterium]